MTQFAEDEARQAALSQLREAALTVYGEERAAEMAFRRQVEGLATAVWRVRLERIEPLGLSPHDPD